jgi:hypothetical protein
MNFWRRQNIQTIIEGKTQKDRAHKLCLILPSNPPNCQHWTSNLWGVAVFVVCVLRLLDSLWTTGQMPITLWGTLMLFFLGKISKGQLI